MAIPADSYEIVRDCRALYLQRLGDLLASSGILTPPAIQAVQDGAGAFFDQIVSTRRRGSFAEQADGLTSSRIALVQEDALELSLRLDSLCARLFDSTGGGLWKLHLRYVTLLREPHLPKTDNPVGPGGIAQGLDSMFAAAGAFTLEQKLDQLDRIEKYLQVVLPGLYAELNDYLGHRGIDAAQPTIVGTGGDASPAAAKRSEPTQPTDTASVQALHRLVSGAPTGVGSAADGVPGGSGSTNQILGALLNQANLERLLARLDDLERLGTLVADNRLVAPNAAQAASGMQTTAGSTPPMGAYPSTETLIPDLFAPDRAFEPKRLRAADLGVPVEAGEGIAIDTVAIIFEAIFADPDLPEAVKAIVASLQIAVLKVAMVDGSLFSDDRHPVRVVLDAIGQLALGLPNDVSLQHPVCARLAAIATRLRAEPGDAPARFAKAVADLSAMQSEQDNALTAAGATYQPLLAQLDRQDETARAARRVCDELLATPVPGAIGAFLVTRWQALLRQIGLRSGSDCAEWHAAVQAGKDLVWTIQPKATSDDRKALAQRLPAILSQLRAGMIQIGMSAEAQDRFLDDCFALQTSALRGVASTVSGDVAPLAVDLPVDQSPSVIAGTFQQGGITVETFDYATVQPLASRKPPCEAGNWLAFLDFSGHRRVGRVAAISRQSRRILLLDPATDRALVLHPNILERQFREQQAHHLSQYSLFDNAAQRALRQHAPTAA